jgi:2-methylcitrate dehydratase PrpD
MGMETTTETVSARLLRLTRRPMRREILERAVLHLIDWIGCAIAGRNTEAGRIFASGPAAGSDAANLAFHYGSLGSILEMDDVHRTALLHPGPVVIPAVLATASDRQGIEVLEAIVAGYEAMIRLGRAVGPRHYASFHNTGTCGGAGSAIAAARMLGLSDDETISAIGNSVTLSAGLWQCRNEPVLTKPLHVAEAARRGAQAADLARRGLTGPTRIFEGPQGFFAAMAADGAPSLVISEPESDWLLLETSFKPWPACRHAHATIDAALALRERIGSREVIRVDVETFADAIRFCDRPQPATLGDAKFSLQHATAVVLAKGRPELADFEPSAIADPLFAKLRSRVSIRAVDRFTSRYPAHFGASVQVLLSDGQILSEDVADAFGDSENPMSEAAIADKFHTLCAWVGLYPDERDALLSAAHGLLEGDTIAPLKEALSAHI